MRFNILFGYIKNKYYNFSRPRKIKNNAKSKLINYADFISGLKNQKNDEKILLRFRDGYLLECFNNDLNAIGETCIIEDYQKFKEWKINKGDIVFDIGAHVGSFSVYAANKGATVYAFEPEQSNYEKLLKNIELNHMQTNIIPFNFGIYSFDGELPLYTSNNNSGGHSLISDTNNSEQKIKVKTLKTIFRQTNLKKVNLLKIDTEGSEYAIFEKLTSAESDKIEKIVGEYHLFPDKIAWNFHYINNLLKKYYPIIKHCSPYYFYIRK